MSFSYTTSDEREVSRIEERLRAAGVRFRKVQTQPQTFRGEEGEEIEVGTARPWNISVANKHSNTLQRIIAEKRQAQDV